MSFQRPVQQIIQARSSWRTYDKQPLSPETEAALLQAIDQPPPAPFGHPVSLHLLNPFAPNKETPQKLGTYGVIRGATRFLAGVVRNGERAIEDFGYLFEWAILVATDLGLGTCWLGGTFQRDAFGAALNLQEDEVIPAVSPVGYARQKRGIVDSVFRWAAGSKDRKPWNELFFQGDFTTPLRQQEAGPYAPLLEMVRLAPSASNRQPWRLVRDPDKERFHLFLQRTPGYQRLIAVDLQRIDMGIALCHFALTAQEAQLPGQWIHDASPLQQLPELTEYVATWTPS